MSITLKSSIISSKAFSTLSIPDLRIGWIGCGTMGNAMCSNLMKANPTFKQISIYNRSPEKALWLESQGATLCNNVSELAIKSDIVFTMLGVPKDVKSVIMAEDGLIRNMKPGSIIVDMTTSEPSLAAEIYKLAKARKMHTIDAPVSGGDIGAKNATLSIFAAGDTEMINKLNPLFSLMGTRITNCGAAGTGQHTKMVNQILIATNMIGVCEGLLYAQRAGLNPETVIGAISSGAAGSWSISNLGPRIIDRNFKPGFLVNHFLKDMGIALAEANKMGLKLPGLELANKLYKKVEEIGHGKQGTHALLLALEDLNKI